MIHTYIYIYYPISIIYIYIYMNDSSCKMINLSILAMGLSTNKVPIAEAVGHLKLIHLAWNTGHSGEAQMSPAW